MRACARCGAPNSPGTKFCGECGAALEPALTSGSSTSQIRATPPPPGATPAQSERRLVSILFADLVGFTTLSEARDPEDVRELLTRYFDVARQLVSRYGGVVEKFIGDAVMAVWGTPVALEDDAERAVRTALDLAAAVAELGREVGAPELRARVGVLTGSAAVTLRAEGQGMVAGDLVNTASRIQAAATPGTVLVGEATRLATEAAVAYEDAGAHELRGKAEPVRLWRALRVVAGAGGAYRQAGLEPPFVGRDAELRLVKELYHASAEERRATLVSILGTAGIGKSRLAWELFKYLEGLADLVLWHRGRCLSYGDGVTYWALAEMVRMRARIAEGEDQATAVAKLHEAVERQVADPDERRWIEPRLANLLGLETAPREREDLFAAWRLFFERLSDEAPTVMVFEDMQWADASLLDFVEYLLDWSRDRPLFIVTLARPELTEKRASWGAGKRSFHSLYLEPLTPEAMRELLDGLVPGMPEELRTKLLAQAEGVPLYAVETVRMLLDRGVLVPDGNSHRLRGTVDALDVPQTLHALIAARLDGLAPDERRLAQDASVLGKTFTRAALAAVGGLDEARLEPLLSALVSKEVLSVQADPRSPERGQYGFVQDLVKQVAYGTLSKRDRKARHLAAAAYLERSWGAEEEEIVEVVASHFLEALRLAPEAADAAEISANARRLLVAAGERAASLAAHEEAARYFEQAAELASDAVTEAELLEQAGRRAWAAGRGPNARALFERARSLFEEARLAHPAARVSARLAEIEWRIDGGLEGAVERMEAAYEVLARDEPDADIAILASQLARLHTFVGNVELAADRIAIALRLAESLWLPEVIADGLVTEAISAVLDQRPEKALALMTHALEFARECDLPSIALRAYGNIAELLCRRDRYGEALERYVEALALARRIGDRPIEWFLVANSCYPLFMTGQWEEAKARAETLRESPAEFFSTAFSSVVPIWVGSGELDVAEHVVAEAAEYATSPDLQLRTAHLAATCVLLHGRGDLEGALRAGLEGFALREQLGVAAESVKAMFVEAVESALELGDDATAERVLDEVDRMPRGVPPQFIRAHALRFRGRLAARAEAAERAEAAFKAAAGMFREIDVPFALAVTLLEHGESLVVWQRADDAEPLLREASEIFERLGARRWIERSAGALGSQASGRVSRPA